MSTSILDSVKKVLGLGTDYDVFDEEVILHINSVLATLTQLGVGPEEGFYITDRETTWENYLGNDPNFNSVKSYLSLSVRLIFDPPQNSNITSAMKEQIKEFEWRINTYREIELWNSPTEII